MEFNINFEDLLYKHWKWFVRKVYFTDILGFKRYIYYPNKFRKTTLMRLLQKKLKSYKKAKEFYQYLLYSKIIQEEREGRKIFCRLSVFLYKVYISWWTGGSNYDYERTIYYLIPCPYAFVPSTNYLYWLMERIVEKIWDIPLEEVERWHNFVFSFGNTWELGKLDKKKIQECAIELKWFYEGETARSGWVTLAEGYVSICGATELDYYTPETRGRIKGKKLVYLDPNNLEKSLKELKKRFGIDDE